MIYALASSKSSARDIEISLPVLARMHTNTHTHTRARWYAHVFINGSETRAIIKRDTYSAFMRKSLAFGIQMPRSMRRRARWREREKESR